MISRKIQATDWGAGVVDAFIARKDPNLGGFTKRNLFRMRQFYEACVNDPIVSPLTTRRQQEDYIRNCSQSVVARREATVSPMDLIGATKCP